jgi:LysR family transcriptional regulator, hydrogen peroxide-inducible genes activator
MITLTQLEYIVAVDNYRHFAKAAEHCFVTQPTLSMQIKKLEDDLGIKIFDRNRQPVVPTDIGKQIIEQARVTLGESGRLVEIVSNFKLDVSGELKIGLIPTLAPYLLPRFAGQFKRKYPMVNLHFEELVTDKLVEKLKSDLLDAAIFVTPFNDDGIMEQVLFYEEMLVYAHPNHPLHKISRLNFGDIAKPEIWLLSDGHCFRSQVINLCSLHDRPGQELPFNFEGGSIDTLIRIIDREGGFTIIPELAVNDLTSEQCKNILPIESYRPLRQVSICYSRHFVKRRLVDLMAETIKASVPAEMLSQKRGELVLWK